MHNYPILKADHNCIDAVGCAKTGDITKTYPGRCMQFWLKMLLFSVLNFIGTVWVVFAGNRVAASLSGSGSNSFILFNLFFALAYFACNYLFSYIQKKQMISPISRNTTESLALQYFYYNLFWLALVSVFSWYIALFCRDSFFSIALMSWLFIILSISIPEQLS
ncbi:hypothetical protein ACFL35_07695 [Candidatus Riflebacteria bacterium]